MLIPRITEGLWDSIYPRSIRGSQMLVREILSDALSTLVLDLLSCIDWCLSSQSILALVASKGGDSKQSEVHLAILNAHKSIVSISPLCTKNTIMFLTKNVVCPARLSVASHMPLSYLYIRCFASFQFSAAFESPRPSSCKTNKAFLLYSAAIFRS